MYKNTTTLMLAMAMAFLTPACSDDIEPAQTSAETSTETGDPAGDGDGDATTTTTTGDGDGDPVTGDGDGDPTGDGDGDGDEPGEPREVLLLDAGDNEPECQPSKPEL